MYQMIVDGIGLAMIIGSTLMEGRSDWDELFIQNYPENVHTVFFFVSGVSLAVLGLGFVMVNAASFDTLHHIEHYGKSCRYLCIESYHLWLQVWEC
jgi:hypothetical protein